jgi:hypothetical protein
MRLDLTLDFGLNLRWLLSLQPYRSRKKQQNAHDADPVFHFIASPPWNT